MSRFMKSVVEEEVLIKEIFEELVEHAKPVLPVDSGMMETRRQRTRPRGSRMTASEEFLDLVDRCRNHCLWFVSAEQEPSTRMAQIELLRLIERYGTRDEFIRAKRLRTWLLRNSNAKFSVS